MKRNNLLLVYVLNLLGLSFGVCVIYFLMIDYKVLYAAILGGLALVFIILSFVLHKPAKKEVEAVVDAYEGYGSDNIDHEEITLSPRSVTPQSDSLEKASDSDTLDSKSSVYTAKETPTPVSSDILESLPIQFKFSSEVYKENIHQLKNLMTQKHLYLENDAYTYRLEALLKLGLVDQKIWKTHYDVIPLVGISRKQEQLIVNVGIDRSSMFPIGVLPKSSHQYFHNRSNLVLSAKLLDGNFKFISSEDHSFETYKEETSVILTIARKG